MNRADETKLRTSLIKAINHWWSSDDGTDEGLAATGVVVPFIGDATLDYMADAALNVLLAISDVQDYLHKNGHMVEEEED